MKAKLRVGCVEVSSEERVVLYKHYSIFLFVFYIRFKFWMIFLFFIQNAVPCLQLKVFW